MKPYILNLADATADLDSVGGKGLSLARMTNAGLPVPGGFHVTTEAYRSFVTSNGIQNRIEWALTELDSSAGLDKLEPVSLAIRLMFSAGEIPADIVQAIKTACAGLRDVPVAVRSSATAEDLPEASFAGQQETYLNLTGTGEIMEAVRQCWASLWTVRAIAYRFKNHIDQHTVALAVVVQKLVFADAAGILFTANPINGRRGEMVINAAWGLGEAVVSGAVTPDTFTVKKATGKIIHREMANKHIMTVRTPSGTQEIPVPNPKMNAAALTSAQIMELAGLGVKIEEFFGMPMDVEWALAGKRFAILQARPITALPPE
jgi:phosphoenolpyruvate synthase/pyruvate phosphate dikinase